MKTDDFVSLLASGNITVNKNSTVKRFTIALIAGMGGTLILLLSFFGLRPDLSAAMQTSLFWIKSALPFSLSFLSLCLANRMARPGMRGGWAWGALFLPVALVWVGAIIALIHAETSERMNLFWGTTWANCPWSIALLSVPLLVATFWVMRGLAPTKLRQAGAAAGLLSGATATLAYCLHCPEMGMPFWGTWYLIGMMIPTLIGALLGPYLLKW